MLLLTRIDEGELVHFWSTDDSDTETINWAKGSIKLQDFSVWSHMPYLSGDNFLGHTFNSFNNVVSLFTFES